MTTSSPPDQFCNCLDKYGNPYQTPVMRTVKKEDSEHRGQNFWCCRLPKGKGCNYWHWANPIENLDQDGYPGQVDHASNKRPRTQAPPSPTQNSSRPHSFKNGLPVSQSFIPSNGNNYETNTQTLYSQAESRIQNGEERGSFSNQTSNEARDTANDHRAAIQKPKPTNTFGVDAVNKYDQTVIQMMRKLRNDLNELEMAYLHQLAMNNISAE